MQFTNIDALRTHRDALLAESDKWFLPDFPLLAQRTKEIEADWKIYRQQLRDLPEEFVDGEEIELPQKPPL